MITFRGVEKAFAGRPVLGPIDLTLTTGKCTVLLGPSGCGKSTLLRLILGLIEPDAGQVAVDSVSVAADRVFALRRQLGYVVQDGGLFPHLTAADNVALLSRHLGHAEPAIQRRLDELTRLARFPRDGLGRFPSQLSGGQRQRVGLMRALALDPDVLLLDEPLGALDPLVRADLQRDLREIFRSLGKTVVLVTHDLAEAAHFADEIVLLRDGQVVQQGPIDELVRRPADPFVSRFIEAQMPARFGGDI